MPVEEGVCLGHRHPGTLLRGPLLAVEHGVSRATEGLQLRFRLCPPPPGSGKWGRSPHLPGLLCSWRSGDESTGPASRLQTCCQACISWPLDWAPALLASSQSTARGPMEGQGRGTHPCTRVSWHHRCQHPCSEHPLPRPPSPWEQHSTAWVRGWLGGGLGVGSVFSTCKLHSFCPTVPLTFVREAGFPLPGVPRLCAAGSCCCCDLLL